MIAALVVIGLIAYVACAGVSYRILRRRYPGCGSEDECCHCLKCQDTDIPDLATPFWPVYWVFAGAKCVIGYVLVAPLRAVFRLCSGEIQR